MAILGPRHALLLILLLLPAWRAAADSVSLDPAGWPIQRELLQHRWDKTQAVELFWAKPEGNGPFPAILFIHGYQDPPRPGGSVFATAGPLMAKRGYVAAALSQPGYGNSSGPPDFCGPFTQQKRRESRSISYVGKRSSSRAKWRCSATAEAPSSRLWSRRRIRAPGRRAGAGAYDFFTWHPTFPGIAWNIAEEAGTSSEAYLARSAIYHAEKIKAPVLLLHGGADERIPLRQAQAFAEKLRAVGVVYRLKIFPTAPHGIPIDEQWREVEPFLEQYLR